MAKIYSLKIQNYRCIHSLEQVFNNESLVVLIGRGDSGKSTILKAISCVLSPNWNLQFADWDFYNCDTSNPIVITAQICELPEDLLLINKHGLHLGFLRDDGVIYYDFNEDTLSSDTDVPILTIQLKVDSNLEPKWNVLYGSDLSQVAEFSASDRAKLNYFGLTDYVDHHFTYAKGSPLYALSHNLFDEKPETTRHLVSLIRNAYLSINNEKVFDDFLEVNKAVQSQAEAIGLKLEQLESQIEFKPNMYTESSISLHSEDIPYKLFGKGSKRLLSIAIQLSIVKQGGIITIDEIEQGLEPDRVRNIIRHLLKNSCGQIFLTTHSKDVVTEVEYHNIFLARAHVQTLFSFDNDLQNVLRAQPDAFFSKRIILCEGATECGIIRAIEAHLLKTSNYSLAANGIVYLDANGGRPTVNYALQLSKFGFDVLAFIDNDRKDDRTLIEMLKRQGVTVVICDTDNALEQQLFSDMSWDGICNLITLAIEIRHGDFSFLPFKINRIEDLNDISEYERIGIRTTCGYKSKNNNWYKKIGYGIHVGEILIADLPNLKEEKTIKKEVSTILAWIKK